ncbi:MAG: hypothetical protein B7C24_01980 [Bacteroidetes bacterium 4572_77]|nr:MAG: hypothetical protein B7C24_01980 [Bacteroidetes bacterium 4572_77]
MPNGDLLKYYLLVNTYGQYYVLDSSNLYNKKQLGIVRHFPLSENNQKVVEIIVPDSSNHLIESPIFWSSLYENTNNQDLKQKVKYYSLLLKLFKEPPISTYDDSLVFRLATHCYSSYYVNLINKEAKKQNYVMIRVHLRNSKPYIVYKSGSFNKQLDFKITSDTVYFPNKRERRWISKQYRKLNIDTINDSIIYYDNSTNERMYEIKTPNNEYLYFRAEYYENRKDKNKHLNGLFIYVYYLMLNIAGNHCN